MPCNCRQGTGLHDHLGDQFASEGIFGIGAPINEAIDLSGIQVWNCKCKASEVGRIFSPATLSNGDPVCSDGDPELLMYVPFSTVCRVRGISIVGTTDDFAPSQVKIFVNPVDVSGFDSVRRLRPHEEIQLAYGLADDRVVYRVNPGKFASTSSLVFFFDESFGNDESHLLRIDLFGENTGKTTQQKVATNIVYELRGNPADHPTSEDTQKFFSVQ